MVRFFMIFAPADVVEKSIFNYCSEVLVGRCLKLNGVGSKRSLSVDLILTDEGIDPETGYRVWHVEYRLSKHMERKLKDSNKSFIFKIEATLGDDFASFIKAATAFNNYRSNLTDRIVKSDNYFHLDKIDYGLVIENF